MGIKSLNDFLRKKCPEVFINLPYTYFYGKRIAIDSDNILRRFMSRAHKEIVNKTDVSIMEPDRDEIIKRWVYHIKIFTLELLNVGATPVFVFDGAYIDEKSETQEKRRADKQKQIDRAEATKEKIMEIDELERTPDMISKLRKEMEHLSTLSADEKEMMIGILSAVGIPIIKATGEGEQLCAMLCIEGKVDAVYSRDTDLVAFGCPLTITEPAGYAYNPATHRVEESLKCTLFKPILGSLGMTYDMFKDLCIMAGCDFNNNIPHFGIGKAYDTLKSCGSIDNLPDKLHTRSKCKREDHAVCRMIYENYEDQTECLNHLRCRDIMGHYPSESISQDEIVLNVDRSMNDARDRLEMYGAEDWLGDFIKVYRSLPEPSSTFISQRPSLSRSTLKLNIVRGPDEPKLEIIKPEGNNIPNNDKGNLMNNTQKASPTKITNKKVRQLSKTQHQRILNKYPKLIPTPVTKGPVLHIIQQ